MNSNCLEGLQCPKCGSYEPFDIEIKTVVRMWDDGSEEGTGDQEWGADSYCECQQCHHYGTVKDFHIGYNAEENDHDL
jgi:hypothetical protein